MTDLGLQYQLPLSASPEEQPAGEFFNHAGMVHRWYHYTQGFAPELVAKKIHDHDLNRKSVVLDPFCGSGTTLVTAKFFGMRNYGIEANPLMAFITDAKTGWSVDLNDLEAHFTKYMKRMRDQISDPAVQPTLLEPIPMKSANKWFTAPTLRELLIAQGILSHIKADEACLKKIRLAFSRAMFDSSQVIMCPGITFTKRKKPSFSACFRQKAEEIVSDLKTIQRERKSHWGKSQVCLGDARRAEDHLKSGTVDFIFTSPPYPTDIEYTRQTRAELYFLGFIQTMQDVQEIKKRMVRGSTKNIYKDDNNQRYISHYPLIERVAKEIHDKTKDKNWGWDYPRMVREYFGDMLVAMSSFKKVMRPGGWCLLVVGDQTCKGVKIPVVEILRRIAADLGFINSYIEVVRLRRSTTHSMSLDESIVGFQKP
jgi:hypothetical protein